MVDAATSFDDAEAAAAASPLFTDGEAARDGVDLDARRRRGCDDDDEVKADVAEAWWRRTTTC